MEDIKIKLNGRDILDERVKIERNYVRSFDVPADYLNLSFSNLVPIPVVVSFQSNITLAPKKLIRTRRAGEGSASEPSLARRVSMCKDAKLSCRGNTNRVRFDKDNTAIVRYITLFPKFPLRYRLWVNMPDGSREQAFVTAIDPVFLDAEEHLARESTKRFALAPNARDLDVGRAGRVRLGEMITKILPEHLPFGSYTVDLPKGEEVGASWRSFGSMGIGLSCTVAIRLTSVYLTSA